MDSLLVRCNTCKGRKKYSPLGHIEVECKPCKGVGYVEQIPELKPLPIPVSITLGTELEQIIPARKKKKRKKYKEGHPMYKLLNKVETANTM